MKKENTIQPFEDGDIFLGCTYLNDEVDDHKGDGRILQYTKNLEPKGAVSYTHLTLPTTPYV